MLAPEKAGTLAGVRAWPIWLLGSAALAVAAAAGCGPSVQSIHEGTVRFEHCYRLDLDAHIGPGHRLACWEQWTQTYAFGQTRDRLGYARKRIRELRAGDTRTRSLDLSGMASADPDQASAPVPTSVHSPPPAMALAPPPTGPDAGSPAPAACLAECEKPWRTCVAKPCGDAGAAPSPSCRQCTEDFRACAQRCLE